MEGGHLVKWSGLGYFSLLHFEALAAGQQCFSAKIISQAGLRCRKLKEQKERSTTLKCLHNTGCLVVSEQRVGFSKRILSCLIDLTLSIKRLSFEISTSCPGPNPAHSMDYIPGRWSTNKAVKCKSQRVQKSSDWEHCAVNSFPLMGAVRQSSIPLAETCSLHRGDNCTTPGAQRSLRLQQHLHTFTTVHCGGHTPTN